MLKSCTSFQMAAVLHLPFSVTYTGLVLIEYNTFVNLKNGWTKFENKKIY